MKTRKSKVRKLKKSIKKSKKTGSKTSLKKIAIGALTVGALTATGYYILTKNNKIKPPEEPQKAPEEIKAPEEPRKAPEEEIKADSKHSINFLKTCIGSEGETDHIKMASKCHENIMKGLGPEEYHVFVRAQNRQIFHYTDKIETNDIDNNFNVFNFFKIFTHKSNHTDDYMFTMSDIFKILKYKLNMRFDPNSSWLNSGHNYEKNYKAPQGFLNFLRFKKTKNIDAHTIGCNDVIEDIVIKNANIPDIKILKLGSVAVKDEKIFYINNKNNYRILDEKYYDIIVKEYNKRFLGKMNFDGLNCVSISFGAENSCQDISEDVYPFGKVGNRNLVIAPFIYIILENREDNGNEYNGDNALKKRIMKVIKGILNSPKFPNNTILGDY